MNYAIWAEDINDSHARVLKARYYGEISYIDDCIGSILDAVEKRGDAENTLICFFADHGDHLGDHTAWQKESFFEASCHIPYLVSWPARLKAGERRRELVCLTDLFGMATTAAGKPEVRQGNDVLGVIAGAAQPRESLYGYHGEPGSPQFKIMVRHGDWKYIWIANGGREQLFNVFTDSRELSNLAGTREDITRQLRGKAVLACSRRELQAALDGSGLREFKFAKRPDKRIYQFDRSRGVVGFPARPEDALKSFRKA
jgi:choline-sulfatase